MTQYQAYCRSSRDEALSGLVAKIVTLLHELARTNLVASRKLLSPTLEALKELAASYPESKASHLVDAISARVPPRPLKQAFRVPQIGQIYSLMSTEGSSAQALSNLDKASQFQPDILRLILGSTPNLTLLRSFDHQLMGFMSSPDFQCRQLAHRLILRLCVQEPQSAERYASAFIAALSNSENAVVTSALPHLAEYVLACPKCSMTILQAAFNSASTTPGVDIAVELRRTLRMLHITSS